MRRYVSVSVVVVFLLAIPLAAATDGPPRNPGKDGVAFSRTDLVMTKVRIGAAELEIYAKPHVDVGRLVAEIDLTKTASSEDVYQRINASRQRLYRDEELVVVGTPASGRDAAKSGEKAKLVRYFYLWNDVTYEGDTWYTTCPTNGSTVAVLFVSVFEGELDFFVKKSSTAAHSYIGTADDAVYPYLTWYVTSNKKTTLGYAWDGVLDTESHIIVYCFQ